MYTPLLSPSIGKIRIVVESVSRVREVLSDVTDVFAGMVHRILCVSTCSVLSFVVKFGDRLTSVTKDDLKKVDTPISMHARAQSMLPEIPVIQRGVFPPIDLTALAPLTSIATDVIEEDAPEEPKVIEYFLRLVPDLEEDNSN
ncbi:hypothetical protein HOD30_04270 [Candidatus Peregrinibacteria bacterium]|jgi:hypothetical protein|nr:hypothetical protein [Candidatus Peregrinibacteria bacterium]MBT4632175.1 hypothetical protein [Candidatus Peregrinibacteria bacterium]MBT5516736.1 hypothetical protein [Candidatus Peregrinibacteria bacterium]MBT5824093.1 hypothetical protein [Candidatus Peregrinibacteria bacterium]